MSWEKRLGIRHAGPIKGCKVSMQLSKNQKAPEANANGTAGYLVKNGKNSGKILKHLKTDKNQL